MANVLNVTPRETRGTRHARRLRRSGKLPAVLYGHGESTLSLEIQEDEFSRALRHGAKLFDLKGSVNDRAIVREVQWDTFGVEVLHVDFKRISVDERISIEVSVVTRGVAPGVKEGGIVSQLVHAIEIETTPAAIPDKLHLNINSLQIGQELTAADIKDLPEGASLITPAETVLVHCHLPAAEVEEEAAVGEAVEPEVIGRKAAEEEEEEE